MPWNNQLAQTLVQAQYAGLITPKEYEAVRTLLMPATLLEGYDLAKQDASLYGIGYLVDGKRVHPSRIVAVCVKREKDEA